MAQIHEKSKQHSPEELHGGLVGFAQYSKDLLALIGGGPNIF